MTEANERGTDRISITELMAPVLFRNLAFHPTEPTRRLPRGRLRRWWLKRSGWLLYGDDGELL